MNARGFIVLLALALASPSSAESLSEAILAAGVVEQKFSFLRDDVRSMFSGELDVFSGVSVNAQCPAQTVVCVFFVDTRRALETPALRGYQGTLELTVNNMLALAPNTILIDSRLAELMVYSLDVDGSSYIAWLQEVQAVLDKRKSRNPKKMVGSASSLNSEEQDAILNSRATQHAFALYRKLQNVEYHLYMPIQIVSDRGAEALAALRQQDRNLAPLAAVFLWQIAHEMGHLRQFKSESLLEKVWQLEFIFPNEKRVEDDADTYASRVVRSYIHRLEQATSAQTGAYVWGAESSYLSPSAMGRLAVASSLSTWRLIGLRQVLHHLRGIPFRDLLFHLERNVCQSYKEFVKAHGLTLPTQDKQIGINTVPSDVKRGRIRPNFLVTDDELKEIRANLAKRTAEMTHAFSYSRVEDILKRVSNGDAAEFVSSREDVEKFLTRITSGHAVVDRNLKSVPTYAGMSGLKRLLATFSSVEFKTLPTGNCPDAYCEIIEVSENKERFAVLEISSDQADNIVSLFYHQRFFSDVWEPEKFGSSSEYEFLLSVINFVFPKNSNIVVVDGGGRFMERANANDRLHHPSPEAAAMIEETVAQKRLCEWGNVGLNIVAPDKSLHTLAISSSPDSGYLGVEFLSVPRTK